MGKPASAWSALKDGGPRELALRSRRWAARALDPPKPAPARRRPRKVTASNVGFERATKFFEARHATYVELARAIEPHLDPEGVLLDVGANIGYFSKVVGEQTGFRGSAHLFEPIPQLARLCHRTLEDAAFSVSVHQFGLSDTDDHLDIFVSQLGNLGWNTMLPEWGRDPAKMQPQRITVRRFDGLGLTATPSVVKIDVEGAEYLVLRGLVPALRRWEPKPVILCEIASGHERHPHWAEEMAILGEVLDLGYRATSLAGEDVDVTLVNGTTDVLLLPR
jgi:FkbM family methyltransferase